MDDKALLDAMRSIVKEATDPIRADIDNLRKAQENLATHDEVEEGFKRLESIVDVAAKDIAKVEKRILEHLEKPHMYA